MKTEKLYYSDPFLREFTAQVLTCEPAKKGYLVTLDRTAFYPEGGGQPADHGILGGVPVTDVHDKEDVVYHTVKAPLEVGSTVTGTLDWDRRFDHMQQHSGEHILSGILCADYHCDNVGFHMGADTVTIDYNTDITWEQVLAAEKKANEVIWADRPVEITYPTAEELKTLDYRSKKELSGWVRIVRFPGADCCACCGVHVLRAGQVGLVKALSCQSFRDGVRIEILCGKRAFDYFGTVYEQNRGVAQQLSVKHDGTLAAVERMEAELAAAKLRMTELEDANIAAMAKDYAGKGDVVLFQPPMRGDGVRKLADAVAKASGGLAAVFAGEKGQYQFALVQAEAKDISALVKAMNQALHGRGGGRNGFAQGRVQAEEAEIQAFFDTYHA